MKVTFKDQTYIISWEHIRDKAEIVNLCGFDHFQALTVCNIQQVGSEEVIEQGQAFCLEEDIFEKEKGRKISLTRALSGFDRDLRRTVWQTYFIRKIQK